MTAAAPPSFPLRWERREPPLPAAAVLALGDAVPALAVAARERLVGGARLGVVAGDGALLVLGAEADLPWADGTRYLGVDAGVLVPTTARPRPAAALWRTAVGAEGDRLCVLLPGHALVADPPPPTTDPAALDPYTGDPAAGGAKSDAPTTDAPTTDAPAAGSAPR
ncbi:bpX5 domain-containing protein [Kitasatospora sp. NPDC003701]